MSSIEKKLKRGRLRNEVILRDSARCRVCEAKDGSWDADGMAVVVEVHHITPRHSMPRGGNVASNLITLCPDCHMTAEEILTASAHGTIAAALNYGEFTVADLTQFAPSRLYALIGSSYERAMRDAEESW